MSEELRKFRAYVQGEARWLVGKVVEELSGGEARERGYTKKDEKRGGKYLFLETEHGRFGRQKKDTKPVDKNEAA